MSTTAPEAYKTVKHIALKYTLSEKTVRRRCTRPVNPWPCRQEFKGGPVRFSPEDEAAIDELMTTGAGVPALQPAAVTTAQLRRIGKKLLGPNRAGQR